MRTRWSRRSADSASSTGPTAGPRRSGASRRRPWPRRTSTSTSSCSSHGGRSMPSPKEVRIAAVADVHCSMNSHDTLRTLFVEKVEKADVLALCGDLTDDGLPDEAHVLAKELAAVTAP